MKRVLLVAYHFPPLAGSSGIQRALRFSTHLPDFGWEPIVLTAHPRAFEQRGNDLIDQVREGTVVIHAQAWDAKRHFAIRGHYPAFLGRPDRWWSWWFGAVPTGLRAIRRYAPDVVWSTYPIATAHSIGTTLSRVSGVPLVADFRDPMAQDKYPPDPATWRSFERIERRAISTACFSTFTSPGAVDYYAQRYPHLEARFRLLENGYDEQAFKRIEGAAGALNPGRRTLLHSGIVYPSERDPTCLFKALAQIRRQRRDLFDRIIVRFRAAVHEELLRGLAKRYDVADAVEVLPALSYDQAVAEMQCADALLVLQASNCNTQIPAKYYEYLRARRPMLILADPAGDTAGAATKAGVKSIAALENVSGIKALLEGFADTTDATADLPSPDAVASASRYARTAELASLLDEVSRGRR